MESSLRDRENDRFREASGGKSKVAVTSEEDGQSLRFDEASSTVSYLGEGLYGALTFEPKWKIKKIDTSSGVVITSASDAFDQVWDDRAALTYV